MNVGELATVVLSIDVELDLDHQQSQFQRRLDEVRRQLVELTKSTRVAATWAVADPLLSAATESILTAACDHELAVLGEQTWLGRGCGRSRLARELGRRFVAPRKLGIPVTTLVLRNVEQVIDLDLLNEHSVTAMCDPASAEPPSRRLAPPQPIRFGLWSAPVPWAMPLAASWWQPSGWTVARELARTIRRRSMLHLRIDALQLAILGQPAMNRIASLMRQLAARRDAGQLQISTIRQLATAALDSRAAAPSRSILSPAA